jgi:hypothetical protein
MLDAVEESSTWIAIVQVRLELVRPGNTIDDVMGTVVDMVTMMI